MNIVWIQQSRPTNSYDVLGNEANNPTSYFRTNICKQNLTRPKRGRKKRNTHFVSNFKALYQKFLLKATFHCC